MIAIVVATLWSMVHAVVVILHAVVMVITFMVTMMTFRTTAPKQMVTAVGAAKEHGCTHDSSQQEQNLAKPTTTMRAFRLFRLVSSAGGGLDHLWLNLLGYRHLFILLLAHDAE